MFVGFLVLLLLLLLLLLFDCILGANWLSRQTLYIWETFTSHSHIRRDQ